ncbi:MAG: hypothetical protein MUF42_17495 [Cytophagaceae bacterium]|nr:hypothetical protein [Cytophagaceae bacterium]
MMHAKRSLFTMVSLIGLLLVSCKNKNEKEDEVKPYEFLNEFQHIRVLVSSENSSTLSLIQPYNASLQNFEADFAKSSLYRSESGRFAAIIHRDNNLTQTFDIGLEFHGDHVDYRGTPKFGALKAVSSKPTHFKSKKGELLMFNDGDGTLTVGKESDIHTPGASMSTIQAGLLAHHGAMAVFSNGHYAITEKDNTVAGALPERVKIINSAGNTVHASTLATNGIHGNASDGEYAVFGSASGILVVQKNGVQKLIPHPVGFGTSWFGTILETAMDGKFIGYTAARGAYLIDVPEDTVYAIIENTDIMQCKLSLNQEKLGILLHSGKLLRYDIASRTLEKEASLLPTTEKSATQKPQLECTDRFAYITSPATSELIEVEWSSMTIKQKYSFSVTPHRLTILGYETDAGH